MPARRRQPRLESLEEQRAWFDEWREIDDSTGVSQAAKDAQVLVRTFRGLAGDVAADEAVDEALPRALGRIERLLGQGTAIVERRSGFPGLARTVLYNEIRRPWARHVKVRARRILPKDAVEVEVPLDGSRRGVPPIAGLRAVRLEVRAWPRRWHDGWVAAHEQVFGDGCLSISGSSTARLRVSSRLDRSPFDPIELTTRSGFIRVYNDGVADLHVEAQLLAWCDEWGWHDAPPRLCLLASHRGIGIPQEDESLRREGRSHAPSPSNVAPRQFVPCAGQVDGSLVELSVRAELATLLLRDEWVVIDGTRPTARPGAWLGRPNVEVAAAAVLRELCAGDAQPPVWGDLVCSLAEWQEPGLHPPHRHPDGHRGGHPLRKLIRSVIRAQALRSLPDRSPNTRVQAVSRLSARVEMLLGEAGRRVHRTHLSP